MIIVILITFYTNRLYAFDPANLTLPYFKIELEQDEYEEIENRYYEDISADASLEYNGIHYEGIVSLRGATSRNQPKKSWKFRFEDSGPGGIKELNLDAAYRDQTLCRNFLSMHLSQYLMMDAPNTSHASLIINNDYKGVFIVVEEIDDMFFENRELDEKSFRIKSFSHGGKFSPFMTKESFDFAYDIKQATQAEMDTFQLRCQIIQWADTSQIQVHLPRIFDINNLITFFAMNSAIVNMDGVTKNFFVHENYEDKYVIIPWDADASFGIDWRGDYYPSYADLNTFFTLNETPVYVRIAESEFYCNLIEEKLQVIVNNGFDYVSNLLDTETALIENDLSYDEEYGRTIEEFHAARDSLQQFLIRRREHINNMNIVPRISAYEINAVPEYVAADDQHVLFTARVDDPYAVVKLTLADRDRMDFFVMNDEGDRGDTLAGDGIYSFTKNLDDYNLPVYYCLHVANSGFGEFPTPPSGLYMDKAYLPQNPSVQPFEAKPDSGDFRFGDFWMEEATDSKLLAIINTSNEAKNINGCYLCNRDMSKMFMFAEEENIPPHDTLFVSNHPENEGARNPGWTMTGRYTCFPAENDTVFLFTSAGKILAQSEIIFSRQEEFNGDVVINEICFTNDPRRESGDWIELYLKENNISITGWSIRDSRIDHLYHFPEGIEEMVYDHGGYLVIAEDKAKFLSVHPDVINVIGGMGFGLGNEGDNIFLYDEENRLIDQVNYSVAPPWPDVAHNPGRTIELNDSLENNFGPENWSLSLNTAPIGTPGKINSILEDPPEPPPPPVIEEWELVSIAPNPFESHLYINVRSDEDSHLRIAVYNVLGQKVTEIEKDLTANSEYRLYWPVPPEWSSGMYFFRLEEPEKGRVIPLVRLK